MVSMINKKVIVGLMIVTMLSLAGCSGKGTDVSGNGNDLVNNKILENNIDREKLENNETKDPLTEETLNQKETETDNGNNTADKNSKKEEKLSELGELSKKLALEMSKGEFENTYNTLSPLIKPQITEAALKESWDLTVDGMGSYIDVREMTEEKSEKNNVVHLVLNYDYSGIKVLFTYNANKQLEGLWFTYEAYEPEAISNDNFEEIEIAFGDKKNPIWGILTLPRNVKNPPVAILVHGSGDHDADESIGANKPFRDIAHGFAKKGIAVIRYNESTPRNTVKEFTIEADSLNDAAEAIKYASSCGKVDVDRIVIVGHSLGGMMAPKIASDNKKVAAIVSLAGSPRRLEDIILDQNKILTKENKSVTEAMYRLHMAQVNGEVKKVKSIDKSGAEIILDHPASYWYSLSKIDTHKIALSLDIPIFIAQGSVDFQVYADIDFLAWQELLKDKNNVTFRLYDNLNHLFMANNGRIDPTEYNIKDTVNQKVIDDIVKWILKI